jgi:glycosyltransferase involved in cell wall biosynthesis
VKIVHFSFSRNGGAGAVANTLSQSLRSLGQDSHFEYVTETNLRQNPYRHPSLTLAAGLDEYLVKSKSFENQVSVFRAALGTHSLEKFRDADVVHLHWIPGQISLQHLVRISKQAKSVVWTLHDMWPLTGGCHYAGSCLGFQTDCSDCPAVKGVFQKSIQSQLSSKSQLANSLSEKIKIVAPSNWLAKLAKSSTIFGHNQISVIPNPVSPNTSTQSMNRDASRAQLGLGSQSFVVGFSAANLHDKRKGLEQLLNELEIIAREGLNFELELLLLGDSKAEIKCPGVKVTQTGLVPSGQVAASLIAIDVLVNFSQEENLSMSLIEALSAGVPVLALDSGGNSDVVQDGKTGYLLGKSSDLRARLRELATDRSRITSFAKAAQEDFHSRFRADKVANRYLELYKTY